MITSKRLIAFNMVMTLVWGLALIPTLLWLKDSILWVAFMSLYANIVGHFSAWVAARAEKSSEENPPQE